MSNELDVNVDSTPTDDSTNTGPTEQELLDAVMKNSPIMDEVSVPLPNEGEEVEDPAESAEVVEDPEAEEVVTEETEEEVTEEEEVEGEDAVEETATQEPEAYDLDELDDFNIKIKIDGKEETVNIQDIVKGYSTEQSLSKKGRELGEARKALDEEKAAKLKEVDELSQGIAAVLYEGEQGLAKEYNDIEKDIQKARDENDTFTVNELKDKREQIQRKYWDARNKREGITKAVQEQQQKAFEEEWGKQIEHFHKEIPNLIPDYNEKVANEIREFAIEEGINPETLNQITDPVIVKFVDDYRRLKQNVKKGVAKRKAVPTKKAVPSKKARTQTQKKQDADAMVKARAFKENASKDDQDAFLKQLASRSLNNL